jgi:16S rRNA (uracil1498-N3)-methyltransferase
VLRQRRGDRVLLFNGDGNGYDAQVENADARACEVHVYAVIEREPSPRLRLHLAQALIKGERLDFVMQKSTELGVTDIWPLETERTEVHIEGHRVARRETHWQRIVESAAEQSGRLRLPELHRADDVADAPRAAPGRRKCFCSIPVRRRCQARRRSWIRCCWSAPKAVSATRSARPRKRRVHCRSGSGV